VQRGGIVAHLVCGHTAAIGIFVRASHTGKQKQTCGSCEWKKNIHCRYPNYANDFGPFKHKPYAAFATIAAVFIVAVSRHVPFGTACSIDI
jgi:hypothetical protein